MKARTALIVSVSAFCLLCAGLLVQAMLDHPQQAKNLLRRIVPLAGQANIEAPAEAVEADQPDTPAVSEAAETIVYPRLNATSTAPQTVTLGALYDTIERTDKPDKYKFQIVLTNKGAAVQQVTLSEFAERGTEEPEPLILLSPLTNDADVYTLAGARLWAAPPEAEHFDTKAFPLNKLNWKAVTNARGEFRTDEAIFEAVLKDADTGAETLRIVKTYRIKPNSYELDCELEIENLSGTPLKIQMQMQGPGGIAREGVRQDTRKIKAAYLSGNEVDVLVLLDILKLQKIENDIEGTKEKIQAIENGTDNSLLDAIQKMFKTQQQRLISQQNKLRELLDRENAALRTELTNEQNDKLLWTALTNMYFAAIVRPVPVQGQNQPWLRFDRAQYYPSTTEDKDAQNCSYTMMTETIALDAAGNEGAAQTYSLATYMGPKDKRIFEKNETYKALQYYQTIDFRACCCPISVIAPLAFGVMWLMNTMYTLMGPLGNYGVVIIILVFLVRLALHPLTKKGQVSMMKMQKLGPKMKEIQAKYANNKQEMNKQVMALYRDAGVSPISGMLPMFIQMPIWIALWTAVYTSIDLRGAAFLPFWITDLSMPDRLFKFPGGVNLPFFGEYFNLLPILMGVVMYLQQKMMPASQTAQPDSQMAHQQKMMMIMMPLMFPLILYSGPSGVNLYIMTSIGAGVIEQKVIRKHLKEKEEAEAAGRVPVTAKTGGKAKKKKPKPFFKG
jgi:YidC/Oxa1 family membrane protein insertase